MQIRPDRMSSEYLRASSGQDSTGFSTARSATNASDVQPRDCWALRIHIQFQQKHVCSGGPGLEKTYVRKSLPNLLAADARQGWMIVAEPTSMAPPSLIVATSSKSKSKKHDPRHTSAQKASFANSPISAHHRLANSGQRASQPQWRKVLNPTRSWRP